ncbi:MAG TPA: endonuclease/exonuclease/phosphatase family protein, partial [Cyclobacteriaceae bacterium]|nr:endonuclease/exonuclease/phosphatase family protein [Cyclobacteriaceae bacterium]
MRTIFLLIISVFIAAFSHAQDSLKILTWNIQMLPSIVKGGGKAKRSEAIVNQLNARNYDVIVFQEIFNKRSRKIITRGLLENYPHRTPVLNRKTLALKSNGGVMIFSKHPIREMHEIRYSKRTGYDRLARKGALLAEIEYKHNTIQVAGTHLQAFGAQEIMYSQYKQLIDELLKPHTKKGVPQFVCGDFNTLKSIPPELPTTITQEFINRLPRYPIMLHTLDAHDGDLAGDQQFT